MAYKIPKYTRSKIKKNETVEGETIEMKIERIVKNKEPIKDGAPIIYTERKHGVQPEYNIRTDRWEIASSAMDSIHRMKTAKRDEVGKVGKEETTKEETKVVKISEAETTQGTDKSGAE